MGSLVRRVWQLSRQQPDHLFAFITALIKAYKQVTARSQRSPLLVILLGHDRYYPIATSLWSFFDAKDIATLRGVSKQFRDYIQDTQFNINTHLQRFVENPLKFRHLQGQCDALMTGAMACQFFRRQHTVPVWQGVKTHSVSIWVQSGLGADVMELYVLSEGYDFHSSNSYLPEPNQLTMTKTYERRSPSGNSTLQIHLYITPHTPILSILRDSFLTCELNILSWNKAYCLFPRHTLLLRETYLLKDLTDASGQRLASAANYGFRPKHTQSYFLPHALDRAIRMVGDKTSLVIPLDTRDVPTPPTPDSVLSCAAFRFDVREAFPVSTYGISVRLLVSEVLQHEYVVWKWGDHWDRLALLAEHLNQLTIVELYKMDVGSRPVQFEQMVQGLRGRGVDQGRRARFALPVGWQFCDGEMGEIMERLLRGGPGRDII